LYQDKEKKAIKALHQSQKKLILFTKEKVIYFLLLVQKKVTKKSTPATIYSRCRTP
jgi:hypothetical protein